MRLLIIGKNGQVGSEMVKACEANGIAYQAVDRTDINFEDDDSIMTFFDQNHQYDWIINAVGYTDVDGAEMHVDLCDQVNHLAVKVLAEQAKKYDIPLFHFSTDYVFDGVKSTMYHEQDPTGAQSEYGKSKVRGEEAIQHCWEQHIILRVSWIFSAVSKNFVKTIFKLTEKNTHLRLISDQYGAPTAAADIARVVLSVLSNMTKNDQWGIYHYSGYPVTTWHQFAQSILMAREQVDQNIILEPITTEQYPLPAVRPKNSALDVTKIQKELGIKQHSWLTYLPDIIDNIRKS